MPFSVTLFKESRISFLFTLCINDPFTTKSLLHVTSAVQIAIEMVLKLNIKQLFNTVKIFFHHCKYSVGKYLKTKER